MSDRKGGQVRRFRLDLGYDGTDFHGWARQPGLRTVQGTLEEAVGLLLGSGSRFDLVVAGRTDAGVHARHQVAHVDIPDTARLFQGPDGGVQTAAELIERRLGSLLRRDPDLVVHGVQEVDESFDARFSATGRRYVYRVADAQSVSDPLRRRDTLVLGHVRLDEDAVAEASAALLGYHDWAAFAKPRDGATTWRTLREFSWSRDGSGVLEASVAADAFCHHMVRYLVGAALAAGRGVHTAQTLVRIRDSGVHGRGITVVPAHGLTLVDVTYPSSAAECWAQAQRARARRSPGTSETSRG